MNYFQRLYKEYVDGWKYFQLDLVDIFNAIKMAIKMALDSVFILILSALWLLIVPIYALISPVFFSLKKK
jgi:hypothetical protein